MNKASKLDKKTSRSLEHLPDLDTGSSVGSTFTLGARTASNLAISDVWSVLDKIRNSYKSDKTRSHLEKPTRPAGNATLMHKIGSGHSTTSTDRSAVGIYQKSTKLATLHGTDQFKFADTFKPSNPFKQVTAIYESTLCSIVKKILTFRPTSQLLLTS